MDVAEIESKYAPLAIIALQLESKELKAGFRETMKAAYQDFGDCMVTLISEHPDIAQKDRLNIIGGLQALYTKITDVFDNKALPPFKLVSNGKDYENKPSERYELARDALQELIALLRLMKDRGYL